MSRIHITALLTLSTLVLPVSIAGAQQIFSGAGTAPTSSQGTAKDNVSQCQAAPGGSRMRNRDRAGCQELAQPEAVRAEQQLNVTLEVPQPEAQQCAASSHTEYSQRNTVARVIGTVSVANCPAGSAGAFNVVARVRDESGEIKPIEFPEAWQRNDTQEVSFNKDYPIGENVDLVGVRVANLKCTCAEAAAAADAATPATAPAN